MLLIFGSSPQQTDHGLVTMTCPTCGRQAPQRVLKQQRGVSLFFIPLARFGTSFEVACSACGAVNNLSKDEARRAGLS